jgi:lipoprotein-releasing system ATP-binding protein
MSASPIMALRGVTKVYGEGVSATRALDGVDLSVDEGEFCALIGPSGSGKSTLLNLMGLLDQPTSGSIEVKGRATSELDEDERTRLRGQTLGFVFQFHHLLPAFTALENVQLPLVIDEGWVKPAMAERARSLLERVGLADKIESPANDLSGGQQQRVAVARALCMRPLLVLADEPTGNLDTESSDQVFELLREINREEGTAFVVVTHDPRIAERCDRIVELVDGRVKTDSGSTRRSS